VQTFAPLYSKSFKTANVVAIKADKGNSTVIMDHQTYIDKCLIFITENNVQLLKKDPTVRFQSECKTVVSEIKTVLTPREKWEVIEMNPTPPRFYGMPKVHKPSIPIRPVVSGIGSPVYSLARVVKRKFVEYSQFRGKYSIKNSIELTKSLTDITPP
jgi:hypothetical protein